ncbi:DUF4226 domain-containing protein [Mycolicibacterium novocastrense]|uniref:DUF4226 domain-containing protein n=1 Tax=Mycolicibacterium novocastrense TaxID=59813 RepID=A0AAW5SS26_MYCNV|nr:MULTISPECIES: DUF4226 domain-containing protein [Mycolicibacterium]MCV7026644.1 DUF4226 domain-containing protein [Mycolicibacterium novocastrense]MDX1887516.1 DUF4226 domain-containing protein [Mycolicibacterium sp. 120270]GAT07601.1 uncharacterized protein RMCN_0734 [Mycolicibacterium novocastrense]
MAQSGAGIAAAQRREALLAARNATSADADAQLQTLLRGAHETATQYRHRLDAIERAIDEAVARHAGMKLTPAAAREFQRFLLAKHKDILSVLEDAKQSDAALQSQMAALEATYAAGDDDWFEGDDNIDRGPAPIEAGPGPGVIPGSGIPAQLISNRTGGGGELPQDFPMPSLPDDSSDSSLSRGAIDGIHGTGDHSMPVVLPPGELGPYGYEEAAPNTGVWIWHENFSDKLVVIPPDSDALAPSNYYLLRTDPDGTTYWWPQQNGPR